MDYRKVISTVLSYVIFRIFDVYLIYHYINQNQKNNLIQIGFQSNLFQNKINKLCYNTKLPHMNIGITEKKICALFTSLKCINNKEIKVEIKKQKIEIK